MPNLVLVSSPAVRRRPCDQYPGASQSSIANSPCRNASTNLEHMPVAHVSYSLLRQDAIEEAGPALVAQIGTISPQQKRYQ